MATRKRRLPGLQKFRDGHWHLDKHIKNYGRLYKSTGTRDYAEAERRAIAWIQEAEQAAIYGAPTRITFDQAAAMYVETQTKKSLPDDIRDLKKVMPYIGELYIDQIHDKSLQTYIADQKEKGGQHGKGAKASTINRSLRIVSRVLTLCASKWRDEYSRPYLSSAPLIEKLPETDKQTTRPIEYTEERELLKHLNDDWKDIWAFAVNSGLRDQAQANLRWNWEVELPTLNTTAFIIPREHLKYGKNIQGDWLLVLNKTNRDIIERWRGKHKTYVFPSPLGDRYHRLRARHFQSALLKSNLKGKINWHSARATFSTRLRAAGVSEEDRQQLMAHNTSSITSQYSWADVQHLINCVEKLCDPEAIDKMSAIFRLDSLKKRGG